MFLGSFGHNPRLGLDPSLASAVGFGQSCYHLGTVFVISYSFGQFDRREAHVIFNIYLTLGLIRDQQLDNGQKCLFARQKQFIQLCLRSVLPGADFTNGRNGLLLAPAFRRRRRLVLRGRPVNLS